ncbi:AAA family ATPase [Nocardiopsis sp. LDBS0036]|uniref:AAA domain-containing protein n=1 Tax=Nocardiopsis sp. LDBS0036 TaxID=3104276 RepID=UPI003517A3A7
MAAHDPVQAADSVERMYRFLLQSEELRGSPVRDLEGTRTLWLGELPAGSPSVVSGLLPDGPDDTWLTADRVLRNTPPAPPSLLESWIEPDQVRDHTRADAPVLLSEPRTGHEDGEDDGHEPVPLTEHPDRDAIRAAHTAWADRWRTWADEERDVAPVARVYEDVFRVQQEFTELGDAHELVLAVGYLTWTSEDRPVRRHLVTRRVVPAMDETGRIEFAPDPDAPGFVLEEDMLEASQRMGDRPRERIREHLAAAGEFAGPDGAEHLHAALREWAASAEAGAHYDEALERHTASAYSDSARVSFAPALVLRPRPKRSQVNALREIVRTVERRGADTGLLRLITGTAEGHRNAGADPVREADGAPAQAAPEPEELYFSLPSNAEQRRIAQRLRGSELVVVQGPPGTGKTHTIANLVTDLLANGQRILITSQTTRALRVLKDKLPEQIKPLAVSRTGDGLEAQRELEGSVRAILERQADHDPARADAEIDKLRGRLGKATAKRNKALRDLRAIRERETYHHPREIGDYQGTLTTIARRLAREEGRDSWIGEVGSDQPTVSSEQALTLLAAARAYTLDHRAVAAEVPEAADLPAPSRYADALAAIDHSERAAARAADSWGGDLDDLIQGLTRERCADLRARVDAFTTRRDTAARLGPRWDDQRADVLAGRGRESVLQDRTTRALLEKVEGELGQIRDVRVDGLEAFPLPEATRYATALREGFEAGRKLSGPFGMRTRLFKDNAAFVTGLTVDGSALDTEAEVRAVGHRVEAERLLHQVEGVMGVSGVPVWQDPGLRLVRLRDHLDDLGLLLELSRTRTELVQATTDLPRLAGVDWSDTERVDSISLILAAVDAGHDAAPARPRAGGRHPRHPAYLGGQARTRTRGAAVRPHRRRDSRLRGLRRRLRRAGGGPRGRTSARHLRGRPRGGPGGAPASGRADLPGPARHPLGGPPDRTRRSLGVVRVEPAAGRPHRSGLRGPVPRQARRGRPRGRLHPGRPRRG